MKAPLLLALLLGSLVALPATAQWKWRDSRGQIHVSDIPPPREVPDRDVLQRPEAPARRKAITQITKITPMITTIATNWRTTRHRRRFHHSRCPRRR